MLSDFEASSTPSTARLGRNRASNMLLSLRAQEQEYIKRYGGSADKYRAMGTVSLLASDLAEAASSYANTQMQLTQARTQRQELSSRIDASLALIDKQAKKVQSEQTAAFTKAGVKIEGSALNVLTQTAIEANNMQAQQKREADFQMSQMKIQETMMEQKLQRAPMETLLGMGSTYAYAKAM
jgi:hypothetical protein